MRVQPGVVQEDLNRAAKRFGLGFGPDTSTSNRATLGGMIGNNSSGSESIVHGTTIDHVLELEVVLADGSQATFSRERGAPVRRAGAGGAARARAGDRRGLSEALAPVGRLPAGSLDPFDLAKLVVGSEGTLAIVTAATVRLVELPKAKMFAVGHFESVAQAIAATQDALDAAAVRGRDDRPHDPRRLSRSKLEFRSSRTGWKATRARCCSSRSPATRGRGARASSTRSRRWASTATATTCCAPRPRPSRTR